MSRDGTLAEAARELRREGIAWYDALADLFEAEAPWAGSKVLRVAHAYLDGLRDARVPGDAAAPSEDHR